MTVRSREATPSSRATSAAAGTASHSNPHSSHCSCRWRVVVTNRTYIGCEPRHIRDEPTHNNAQTDNQVARSGTHIRSGCLCGGCSRSTHISRQRTPRLAFGTRACAEVGRSTMSAAFASQDTVEDARSSRRTTARNGASRTSLDEIFSRPSTVRRSPDRGFGAGGRRPWCLLT